MDPAHFSGFAVFAGSIVVALSSLVSAWLSKKHEARARRASENKVGRQKLYAQFIDEASKLYMDALVRDQAEVSAMVSIYALISRMRMASNPNVVEKAEAIIRTILTTYSRPNKTFPELQNLMLNRGFVDPLLTFSEVCRDELRDFPREEAWADQSGGIWRYMATGHLCEPRSLTVGADELLAGSSIERGGKPLPRSRRPAGEPASFRAMAPGSAATS